MTKKSVDLMDAKKIGEQIKKAREEQGISRREMSESIGVWPSTIQRIEEGSTMQASFWLIRQIENYLGINVIEENNFREYTEGSVRYIVRTECAWSSFEKICDYILSAEPDAETQDLLHFQIPFNILSEEDFIEIKNLHFAVLEIREEKSFSKYILFSSVKYCTDPYNLIVTMNPSILKLLKKFIKE